MARMWQRRGAYGILMVKPERERERDHLEGLHVDNRITLK